MSSSLSFGIHVRGRVVWVSFVNEGDDKSKDRPLPHDLPSCLWVPCHKDLLRVLLRRVHVWLEMCKIQGTKVQGSVPLGKSSDTFFLLHYLRACS